MTGTAINIDLEHFDACGSEVDPCSRMLGIVELNGSPFEVVAYAVQSGKAQDPLFVDTFDSLRAALASRDATFQTVRMMGRDYAVFVVPVLSMIN